MSTGNLQVSLFAFLCVSHHERQRKKILPLRCWNQCSASSGEFSLLAKQLNNHSSNNLACGPRLMHFNVVKVMQIRNRARFPLRCPISCGRMSVSWKRRHFLVGFERFHNKAAQPHWLTDWLTAACDSSALTCTVSEPPLPPLSPSRVVLESSCHSANQSLQCVTSCSEEKGSCSTHCVSWRSPTILAVLHVWVKEWTLQTQHFNVCGV